MRNGQYSANIWKSIIIKCGYLANHSEDESGLWRVSFIVVVTFFLVLVAARVSMAAQNGETTKWAQLILKERGFYYGSPTSQLDDVTVTAILHYQQNAGLKMTGVLDEATIEKMLSDKEDMDYLNKLGNFEKYKLSLDEDTSDNLVILLSKDKDVTIRRSVASREGELPDEALDALAHDPKVSVRRIISKRKHLKKIAFCPLSKDDDVVIQDALAGRQNVFGFTIAEICQNYRDSHDATQEKYEAKKMNQSVNVQESLQKQLRSCWNWNALAGLEGVESMVVNVRVYFDTGMHVSKVVFVDGNGVLRNPNYRSVVENVIRAFQIECAALDLPREVYANAGSVPFTFAMKDWISGGSHN